MSDFRCEWQALHGPRCSHQCNECKDNDTPPEPRMTSERQETEQTFEAWYERLRRERGGAAGPLDAMDADATQMLLAAYYDSATPRAVPDETREAVAFTASAGTCRRCGSRVRMGGPAPDSCTNCAAPAESHPPRAGEGTEAQEMMNAFGREIDHYRNLLADAYVTIGCAVASEDGLDGSEADAFHAKVRRLWPAAVDHPTVARWLALPEEGDTDILGRPS